MSEQYRTCNRCGRVHLADAPCGGHSEPGVVEALQATIAQQQTRIEAAEGLARESQEWAKAEAAAANDAVLRVAELEQALAAERERAEKAEHEVGVALDTANSFAKRILKAEAELQAEREKSARLEALAGLATWLYEQLPIGVDLTEFRAKYRALSTQAPVAGQSMYLLWEQLKETWMA